MVFGRFYRTLGIGGYIGAGVIVAALLLALPILFHVQTAPGWRIWLGVLGTLGAIPALDAAVALVNQGVTHRFGASLLPALELRAGVPKHLRTLVVVPTLLTTHEAVNAQIALLEIHHLASRAGDVQFALLSDWTDAASEEAEGDQALLRTAIDGVARLNQRHEPAPGGERFLLFHRRRVWNESQRKWLGWERKRGKLHELNRLLRGASDTTFLHLDGRPPQGRGLHRRTGHRTGLHPRRDRSDQPGRPDLGAGEPQAGQPHPAVTAGAPFEHRALADDRAANRRGD